MRDEEFGVCRNFSLPGTIGVRPLSACANALVSIALASMRVYAAMSEQMSDEALELFGDRQMAELMVENWDRDEPDRAGELHVERVELETETSAN